MQVPAAAPVAAYVLDFYCPELRLVIELDGGQHHDAAGLARDRLRAAHLERQGLEVLRFSNLDVLQNLDSVLTELLRRIEGRASHPSPQPRRDGRDRLEPEHRDRPRCAGLDAAAPEGQADRCS